MSKAFLFADVETTGLNPEKDHLLEVAWRFTDEEFRPIGASTSLVISVWDKATEVIAAINRNQYVSEMHRDSGLWDDLWGSGVDRWTLSAAGQAFYDHIKAVKREYESIHLAGYSVNFDREFFRAQPTKFSWPFERDSNGSLIHHRVLDLSSVRMMMESAGLDVPVPRNDNPHRALNDVLETIEFARESRDVLTRARF
ncbi:DnaQ-like DNA polymerase III subunit [Microbacterium phage Cece]|nr:DnaQ-like DNA polymerase III subunit [Microbacterium phage Cece]